jgi:hypothetical protein
VKQDRQTIDIKTHGDKSDMKRHGDTRAAMREKQQENDTRQAAKETKERDTQERHTQQRHTLQSLKRETS